MTTRDFFLFCRQLKEDGYPQPTPGDGQIWFNELGVAHQLYSTVKGGLASRVLSNGHLHPFSGQKTEGMVYFPNPKEIIKFLTDKENAATGEGAAGIQ